MREIEEMQVGLCRKLSKGCCNSFIVRSPDNVEEPSECFIFNGSKVINSEFPIILILELLLTLPQIYGADHRTLSEFS